MNMNINMSVLHQLEPWASAGQISLGGGEKEDGLPAGKKRGHTWLVAGKMSKSARGGRETRSSGDVCYADAEE